MPGTHILRINRSNGHVINDHLQAKNSCVSRAQWRADTIFVTSSPRHALKSKLNIAFFLPDTLAVRLFGSSFAFSFCKLQLPYLRIYFKAYA